jgi:hypothetical protein
MQELAVRCSGLVWSNLEDLRAAKSREVAVLMGIGEAL